MSFIYLASPYSSRSRVTRRKRHRAALSACAWLLRQRQWAYSPIIHCHGLAETHNLPTDAAFWQDYNFAMLARSRELMILTLADWATSPGVAAETSEAKRLGLPITFLRPALCGIEGA
jgi:hypothetical protein